MKRIKYFAFILTTLFVTTSCSQKTPEEKYFGHIEAMIDIFEENVDDCDKAETILNKYLSTHDKELEELVTELNIMDSDLKEKFPDQCKRIRNRAMAIYKLAESKNTHCDIPTFGIVEKKYHFDF